MECWREGLGDDTEGPLLVLELLDSTHYRF